MKKIYFLFLLICSSGAYAQVNEQKTQFISEDSIPYEFGEAWKFMAKDDSAMALPNFDDSKCSSIKSNLNIGNANTGSFNGIGWFRLHFVADTSLVEIPMAFTLNHLGASEVYIDGQLIKRFGIIRDAVNSSYFDPGNLPFVFTLKNTGEHLIAIRYANFDFQKNKDTYFNAVAGFQLQMGKADVLIQRYSNVRAALSFVLVFIGGIFIALALLHLLLFLYSPKIKTNLYFSVFVFCMSVVFFIAFINLFSNSPNLELNSKYIAIPLACVACLSIVYFINELFGKKRGPRFWIIVGFGCCVMLLRFFNMPISRVCTVILIASTSFEAAINIVIAIYNKVKGARIIGAGILFFALFILTMLTMGIVYQHFDISDATPAGRVIIGIMLLAIIGIPVSMSAYLAWSFGAINNDLQLQLEQVKLLSAKTLEQEVEKKRILENQKEELELQVKQRTVELETTLTNLRATQEQLVQSEKMAVFGAVATRIAHELLNPVNFVNNFAELSEELLKDFNAAKTEEERSMIYNDLKTNLQKIAHHGKRADSIVKQLFEHTRAGTAHEFFDEDDTATK